MAIELGAAYISILPSTDKLAPSLKRGLVGAEREARLAGDRAGSAYASSFGSKFKGWMKKGLFAGLAGGSLLAGMGLKTAGELEQSRIGFETMLGSAKKADKFLAQIKKTAAETPFELKGLTQSSQKLLAMGFAAKDVIPTLTTLGDAAAGLGVGQEGLDKIVLAVGQMNAKGKVQSDELLQLTEAGIPALKILANGFHVSTGEMQDLVTKTDVAASKAIPMLLKGMRDGSKGLGGETAKFGGLMAKQSKSLLGLLSTLKDTVLVGMADALEPLMPLLKEGLTKAIEGLGKAFKSTSTWAKGHREELVRLKNVLAGVLGVGLKVVGWLLKHNKITLAAVTAVGALLAVTKLHAAFLAVQAAGGLVGYIKGIGLVSKVTKTWTAVQWLLNIALNANPIGLAVIALAALALGIYIAWKKSETFRKVVLGAWDAVKTGIGKASLWIVDKVLWLAEKILGAMAKAFGWAPGIGEKLKSALAQVKDFRDGVNAELNRISDEPVIISLTTIRSASKNNDKRLGKIVGGGGRIPASAMGGSGVLPRISAPMGPVRSAASGIAQTRHEIAMQQAGRVQDALKKSAAAGLPAMGRAGHALRPGTYSIGMPFLGYPGHYGSDYPAAIGTGVYSPWAGRVLASYDLPGSNKYNNTPYRSYGRVIKIGYANGTSALFAHLSQRAVSAGQTVSAGQLIGAVGMNGNATGPHLHFEFTRGGAKINPASLGIFDNGGVLPPGGLAFNASKRPEAVFNDRQFRAYATDKAKADGEKVVVHQTINTTRPMDEKQLQNAAAERLLAKLR